MCFGNFLQFLETRRRNIFDLLGINVISVFFVETEADEQRWWVNLLASEFSDDR